MRNALAVLLLIVSVGLHGPAWMHYSVPHEPADNAASTDDSDACQVGLPSPVDQPALLKSAFAEVLMVATEDAIDWLPAERIATSRPPAIRLTLQSQHVLLRI